MKVRRYIAVLGLIGVCLIALAVARMPAAKSLIGTSQQDVKRIKEDPTPIQERVLTEKQNRHRKLFHHNGPKLRELADRNAGDVEIVEGSGHQIKVNGADSNPSVLQTALCNADVVVVGIVNDKSSHLTEAENFIFTDLDMKVEEILKANPSTPLSISESVTVTRDGGAVTLNGRTFRASRDDFEPMLVGKRYLLFLRLVPETGSYLAYGNGSFQLEENTVSPLGEGARQEIFHGELKESKTFMDEIRALTANGCEKK